MTKKKIYYSKKIISGKLLSNRKKKKKKFSFSGLSTGNYVQQKDKSNIFLLSFEALKSKDFFKREPNTCMRVGF